jgi:hypothetical protein
MHFHAKLLTVSALCVFSAVALTAAPAKFSELKSQLSSLPSIENKLEFLKTALLGQSLENKATLGASIIQSAPPEKQKEIARNVAQILAGLKDGPTDTPQLATLLTNKLPHNLAGSLAGSIAIGAGNSDPQHLPQITAAVIVAQPATIAQAGLIAEEVTAAAPLEKANLIASAIGAKFVDYPSLVEKAPKIAVGITHGILTHQAGIDQIRKETAHSIAALTVLLPGSIRSNQVMITQIGKEVAAAIATDHPGLATTIVGITSAALKAAAGTADITPVLDGFRDAFKDAISDPVIQGKLDQVVSNVATGADNKDIKPIENPGQTAAPAAGAGSLPSSYSGGGGGGGGILSAETNIVNQ